MNRHVQAIYALFCLSMALTSLLGCSNNPITITSSYAPAPTISSPDYKDKSYWAALPKISNETDKLPLQSTFSDQQKTARADVFLIHPTTYTEEPSDGHIWNASLDNLSLNHKTDQSTILNQASVFSESCRAFAPRYRHYAFVATNLQGKKQALEFAYADIRAALGYYLKHDNTGRPIVIAAHQGTLHATRLLSAFFNQKQPRNPLVVTYLIGMAVQPDVFSSIPPGTSPTQIRCFVSWNTFAKGYVPDWYEKGLNTAVCTNPLSCTTDNDHVFPGK